jgi:hypothetical protein
MSNETREELKGSIKEFLATSLKKITDRKAGLKSRKEALLQEIKSIDREIEQIDKDLKSAIRETLGDLDLSSILSSAPRGRKPRSAGPSYKEWVIELIKAHGQMQSGSIYEEARKVGRNPKTLGLELTKMASKGMLKTQKIEGKRGLLYSLP